MDQHVPGAAPGRRSAFSGNGAFPVATHAPKTTAAASLALENFRSLLSGALKVVLSPELMYDTRGLYRGLRPLATISGLA